MEKTLQDICREAKEYQHLTTQDLADLTDLSSSTISNTFLRLQRIQAYTRWVLYAPPSVCL